MKRLGITALAALTAGTAWAHSAPQSACRAHGYGFFAVAEPFDDPGSGLAFGGGGEGFLKRGWSLGGDLAYLFPASEPSGGIGLASLSTGYHFARTSKFVPFLAGGYTLGFRSGVGHFFHYGGGATYWFSGRVGFRVEVRDLRWFEYPRDHLWMVRFGAAFR